jgi:thiosulfate/3-mercaptopyruvate sulfurtransferase
MFTTLITPRQLQALSADPSLRLFDCRYALMDPRAGAAAYAESHLPGAVFIDLNRELSTPHIPGQTGRHPLPDKSAWIATVCRLGISPDTQVVVYDDGGGSSAARMWWMLKWIGHNNVAVLDGGWQAWIAAGLRVTTARPRVIAAVADKYSSLPPLVELVQADAIDGTRQYLLDARDLPRYLGEVEPIDPVAGHIPGALCSPYAANLQGDKRFKSAAELREKFAAVAEGDKPVVCYCGYGVTACHNILAMAVAELPLPALYAGSWSEWITDPARSVALGENT